MLTSLYAAPYVLDSGSASTVGTVTTLSAVRAIPFIRASGTPTGTVTTTNLFWADFAAVTNVAVTLTTLVGLFITNPPANPTITNLIGIDIAALTRGATLNIGIRNNTVHEQGVATSIPGTPATCFLRFTGFTTTTRDVPTFVDDGGFRYMAVQEARFLIPRPIAILTTNALGGPFVTETVLTTTTGRVHAVVIDSPILVVRLAYNVQTAGSANNVTRFAIYSADGAVKYLDTTHATGASTGNLTFTFTAFWLNPGVYYFFRCQSSGTTGSALLSYDTVTGTFGASPTGAEDEVEGTITVTAGAAPSTIDPTAITSAADTAVVFRLDIA